MDETDKKILEIMRENARISFQDLGDLLGMSRVAAQKRVKKLEKEGVIRGYNTCIYRDDEVTGIIDIVSKGDNYDTLVDYLGSRVAEIHQMFTTAKKNHIHVVLVSDSLENLNNVVEMIKTDCKQDIEKMSGYTLKNVIKDVYGGVEYEKK